MICSHHYLRCGKTCITGSRMDAPNSLRLRISITKFKLMAARYTIKTAHLDRSPFQAVDGMGLSSASLKGISSVKATQS